ncbi:hypothetical protein BJ508DRAFT_410963 [Ascobolus immersus RN42]|uniref:Uncharacterized protein n=1 Tax=Ascobolus immersus RN42 TaxID=1160509 RepID=A0A3N4ILM1_ASCIM|nr:hypothetical protein BJ508DRAFT_410963 [Ascobolus immersus RN42]
MLDYIRTASPPVSSHQPTPRLRPHSVPSPKAQCGTAYQWQPAQQLEPYYDITEHNLHNVAKERDNVNGKSLMAMTSYGCLCLPEPSVTAGSIRHWRLSKASSSSSYIPHVLHLLHYDVCYTLCKRTHNKSRQPSSQHGRLSLVSSRHSLRRCCYIIFLDWNASRLLFLPERLVMAPSAFLEGSTSCNSHHVMLGFACTSIE